MKFTSKLILALTFIGTSLSAQNAAKWVPENAFMATGIKLDRLNTDLTLNKATQREFYKYYTNKITKSTRKNEEKLILSLLETPEKYDINVLDGASGFLSSKDSLFLGGAFFGLTSTKKIELLVDSLSQKFNDLTSSVRTEKLSYFISEDIFVAWNAKKVLIGGGKVFRKNRYGYYGDSGKSNREVQEKEYLEKVAVYLDEIFAEKSSIVNNTNFKAHSVVKKDLWFYTDYSSLISTYMEFMSSMGGFYSNQMQMSMINSIKSLYGNVIYAVGVNFNQSDLIIDLEMQQGEKLRELASKIYDRKLNKKFFKYLPSTTVGFVSVAVNIEESINGMFELYKPMMQSIPRFGQKATTVIELVQLALDEEGLGSILQGDMLFAVHNLPVLDKEVKEYVMDEDYNYKDTTFIKRKMDPKFVLMATIGKEESFDIILKGIMALEAAEVDGKQYKLRTPRKLRREFGNFSLIVHDDIAFFTNDDSLINHVILKGGLPKNLQIDKRLQKLARKSPSALVFDPQSIYTGLEETVKLDSAELILFNAAKKMNSSVEITTSKMNKKMVTSKVWVKNANSTTSIGQALDLLDAFHSVEEINRAKWRSYETEATVEGSADVAAPTEAITEDVEEEAAAEEIEVIEAPVLEKE